ncbi:MAG: hypothetical protein QG559_285 [Campylobacterota bacterium]|nr:hypothetical protein [Campylobacterota bacterium]
MDQFLYLFSLLIIGALALMFYRNNSFKLMILTLLIGVYIIYSHKTGETITGFKNEMIESIDSSAKDFTKEVRSGQDARSKQEVNK